MEKNPAIQISVRNLVEFVLRSGDLDTRFTGMSRALEGTKAHQKIQRSYKEGYTPEVFLSHLITYRDFSFKIDGRADGILIEDNRIFIDEIKTTTRPLELIDENYNPLHWAQAKCYGYIYGLEHQLEEVHIQLTYYQLDTEEIKYLRHVFSFESLQCFFYDLLDQYLVWAGLTRDWKITRDASIKQASFPFPLYRKGQREFAVAVYKTIVEEKRIFVQAPTGIGKTISTLFPAIKAMGEGHTAKLFYLTAKTITRQVAEDAFLRMGSQGLRFKSITLTAKDKICLEKEGACNPEQCSFAKGHFNRVNDALLDLLKQEDIMTRNIVETYARKHHVCPFELSLDLSLWADCVICDYNYVFDPRVYLKRFFDEEKSAYTLLIDEAHNLVDRGRDMYSAALQKESFLTLKKAFKKESPKIAKALNKINTFMIQVRKDLVHQRNSFRKEDPSDLYPLLRGFIKETEEWLTQNEGHEAHGPLLDLYFEVLGFLRISELYDSRYVTLYEIDQHQVMIKLFCLDPSYLLREGLKRGKAAAFFSATLTPLPYFREILGGDPEDPALQLSSPFDPSNLGLFVAANVSTKYRDRENSYENIASYVYSLISARKGNYLVFFPSYAYMQQVVDQFRELYPTASILVQTTAMQEEEKEAFLERFQSHGEETLVAFAVLGGIFSEGIDLVGERLLGAVIVGVGLPQLSFERDIILDYFQKKNSLGYEYAYLYPGMNKVLQAVGRVIRSEEDRGVALLVDERFTHRNYQKLFPRAWYHHQKINTPQALSSELHHFWGNKK